MELTDEHFALMEFIRSERESNGTCSFERAEREFGKDIIIQTMIDFNFIAYDGKKPLGLKLSDTMEETMKPDKEMMKWFAPAGNTMDPKLFTIVKDFQFGLCDARVLDIEHIPEEIRSEMVFPNDNDIDSIKVNGIVKAYSHAGFFWMQIVKVSHDPMDPEFPVFHGRSVEDHGDIRKDEVLEFCSAHICDVL